VEVKRYEEGQGKTLEEAVDNTVKKVPSGEYLKNVKVFYNGTRFKIQGYVWGVGTGASAQK
jgi:hypothetical protein